MVALELAESGTVLDFEPKEINASARVFFGVVSALAACLDLAVTPFLGEPCETGFEWPTAGVSAVAMQSGWQIRSALRSDLRE